MRSLKTDLPTSRFACKRLATKGFGAGGVSLTPPVNLPCRPSSVHPKSVIRNRIAHCRDGLHCPSASRKLPLETTHSWSEFVSSKHEKAWEVTREVTRDVWREVDIRQNQWYSMFYEYHGRCFTKNLCQPIAGLRVSRKTMKKTDGTEELFWRQTGQKHRMKKESSKDAGACARFVNDIADGTIPSAVRPQRGRTMLRSVT